MPSYTVAFKEEILRKVLSTDRCESIQSIADNSGVNIRSVRRWITRYREIVGIKKKLAKTDKINSVLSTINLPFEQKSVYCRKNGIMPEELEEWELELKDVLSSGAVSALEFSKIKKEKDELKKQLLAREKELERKDKALAEAAALLLLQKKVQDLLEEEDKKLNPD